MGRVGLLAPMITTGKARPLLAACSLHRGPVLTNKLQLVSIVPSSVEVDRLYAFCRHSRIVSCYGHPFAARGVMTDLPIDVLAESRPDLVAAASAMSALSEDKSLESLLTILWRYYARLLDSARGTSSAFRPTSAADHAVVYGCHDDRSLIPTMCRPLLVNRDVIMLDSHGEGDDDDEDTSLDDVDEEIFEHTDGVDLEQLMKEAGELLSVNWRI